MASEFPMQARTLGSGREAVLPSYTHQKSSLERLFKHSAFLAACVFVGLIYGFLYTLLPPQALVYLLLPILILMMIVVWALPETEVAPRRLLAWLLFAYVGVLFLWPNYMAIQLPGLPWISLRRLIAFGATFVFLLCYSLSREFKQQVRDVIVANKWLAIMVAAFTANQFLTMAFSARIFFSINNVLDALFLYTIMFFVALWVLREPARVRKCVTLLIACAVILCFVGFAEFRNQRVLWADHIPSFLRVDEAMLERFLKAYSRDQGYRTTTTFSVALCFAEFLAIVTPFVIHKIMTTTNVLRIALWLAVDLILLAGINITQSRSGILGWIVAHAVYGCLWAFRRWKDRRADLVAPAVSLLYPLGAMFLFVGMFTIPAIRNRTIGGGSTAYSDNARREQFELLWPKLFENPFGYGAGSSGVTLGYYSPGGQLTVDSYIITLLLDYGVIGCLLFFGMLIYATVETVRVAWVSRPGSTDYATPLAAALIVAATIRMVLSQPDNLPLIWILLGMAAAIVWRHKKGMGAGREAAGAA